MPVNPVRARKCPLRWGRTLHHRAPHRRTGKNWPRPPNRYGVAMTFAICNEIYRGWTLPDTFAHARQAGYDAVEIAPFTLSPYVTDLSTARRSEIRDQAARAGIGISGIHWVLFGTEGLHLTAPDAAIRQRTSRYFRDLVAFCADLGGTRMIVGSPKQRNLEFHTPTTVGMERATEVLRDAVRDAEDRGVVLCFEPLAPFETNFINRAADALQLAEGFRSPAASVILDVKALCGEPGGDGTAANVPAIIRACAGRFAYFHANDRNLKGPGFGDVDFRPIAAALREAHYDGVVSVEVFNFDEGPEVIATQSRANLRAAFGQ